MSAAPPLSLIVGTRNPGPLLAVTLASIAQQRFVAPELIVVDRGSTDGTAPWLEANRARFATVVAVAPGPTLPTAWNTGLAAAQGDWVLFLEAGDRPGGGPGLGRAPNWVEKNQAGG